MISYGKWRPIALRWGSPGYPSLFYIGLYLLPFSTIFQFTIYSHSAIILVALERKLDSPKLPRKLLLKRHLRCTCFSVDRFRRWKDFNICPIYECWTSPATAWNTWRTCVDWRHWLSWTYDETAFTPQSVEAQRLLLACMRSSHYPYIGLHTYIHTYIHTSSSAPFTIKTRPTVHFSGSTEVKQLINKKGQLTPRSARDSSAAWWIGLQYRQWLKMAFFHTPLVFGAPAPYLPVGISGCRSASGN